MRHHLWTSFEKSYAPMLELNLCWSLTEDKSSFFHWNSGFHSAFTTRLHWVDIGFSLHLWNILLFLRLSLSPCSWKLARILSLTNFENPMLVSPMVDHSHPSLILNKRSVYYFTIFLRKFPILCCWIEDNCSLTFYGIFFLSIDGQ